MSLDLEKTANQIEIMASRMRKSQYNEPLILANALKHLTQADIAQLQKKRLATGEGFEFPRPAGLTENMGSIYQPPEAPKDFRVLAVDGSHIDVDRHMPSRCYLINIGGCILTYGSNPDAQLFSRPRLYAQHDELYLSDPTSRTREVSVTGEILGWKRAVEEAKALAETTKTTISDLPILTLLDGSLVMFRFPAQGQDFVRDIMLKEGLIPALDSLYSTSLLNTLATASYISLPRGTDVVNSLRMNHTYCPYNESSCHDHCGDFPPLERPCHDLNNILDRQLFETLLKTGERSAVFYSTSPVVEEHYGPHQIYFYYLNVGEEIGRVEMPRWVAQNEKLLDLTHSLVLDQCRRGMGYPAALTEAHEQAVISGSDRESFKKLVETTLYNHRVPVFTSEKSRAKMVRGV